MTRDLRQGATALPSVSRFWCLELHFLSALTLVADVVLMDLCVQGGLGSGQTGLLGTARWAEARDYGIKSVVSTYQRYPWSTYGELLPAVLRGLRVTYAISGQGPRSVITAFDQSLDGEVINDVFYCSCGCLVIG
jgi:hypothetical protein